MNSRTRQLSETLISEIKMQFEVKTFENVLMLLRFLSPLCECHTKNEVEPAVVAHPYSPCS